MNAAPPPLRTCTVCQSTLDPNGTCPRCRAPEDWTDQIDALDFVVRRLKDWHQSGQLTDRQLQSLSDSYAKRREMMVSARETKQPFQADATFSPREHCWSCAEYLYKSSSHCHHCGAPVTDPGVRSLRYLEYLDHELRLNEESGWLTLRQAHELLAETSERMDALKRKLERDRAPFVLPVEEEPPPPRRRRRRYEEDEEPAEETGPRRTFLEVLLDPHSIQWLLAAGGGLIVLGIVIWLTSLGLFEKPEVVAVGLGLGNAALIAGGWALILKTRFENAGRALTLLACLVLPLNLWFYHTHDLITLSGSLWIPAVFCCIVYTASAFVLRDSLFVYVLVGGITLTAMLILARMDAFEQIFAPTMMLVVLALICLHAERAFPPAPSPAAPLPEGDGSPQQPPAFLSEGEENTHPFSREKFGLAFYWCSLFLMGSGLLLLLAAQTIGWLHQPLFRHLGLREAPLVSTRDYLPFTLLLVLAGVYYYIYADLVVRKIGTYIYVAAFTVLWAEIHLLVIADPPQFRSIVIIALALTAVAVNLFQVIYRSKHDFLRRIPPLGILLCVLPVAYGILLHLRATNSVLHHFWEFNISWPHVLAMAVTALSCRAGAHLYRHTLREVSIFYFFLTAVATLLFAASLTWMMGLEPWEQEAPLIMLVPILYLGASYLYRGHTPENPLIWAAHGAVGLMLFFSAWVALGITPQVANVQALTSDTHHLLLALFCLEAAVFYGVAAFMRRTNWTIYFATVMLCGAIWQLLRFFHTPNEFYTIAFALPGFALLVIYRLGVFEKMESPGLERATFQSANALTTLGFTSGALLSLSRVFLPEAELRAMDAGGDWKHPIRIVLFLLIALTIISLLSAWLVQHQVWRRVYLVLSIVNGVLLVLVIHRLSNLDPWQRLEIFAIILGLLLVGVAYVGWYWETERTSDLVSFAFLFGSIGMVLPLLVAIVVYRINEGKGYRPGLDDLVLILFCVALFGSGVMCRIKTTTLVASSAMGVYLLIFFIALHGHLKEAWIIGIYLTLGGVLLFGTGLFLSLYRDWLLSLPDKVRRREGLFRIFDWR